MKAAEEWGALAEAGPSDDYVLEEDPEFLSDINRICTFGLKAMLKDDYRGVNEWKDELNQYGTHFAEVGNKDAAVFVYTLYQMAEHKLPTESLSLKGIYLTAFGKIYNVLDDSGWELKRGDEKTETHAEGPSMTAPDQYLSS
eukprot:CAMPEP_0206139848 /NCGR_PEP_ID=MMETSP1473-20131121/7537_1 /ASSEMBLY_ACC=CAM_ASM_001109 /TAXON_ID=1461547 /ORGANISM="Stichococcus sp, Strain RCC1054" /LENGTH=141 /DNA_ID=CAMNT_0053533771 /DNA_START=215 /DNA_END=640 /DNA_ORIENTATION=+